MQHFRFTEVTEYVTDRRMSKNTAFPEFRKATGKTLEEVAAIFGVDRRTIIRWEKGEPPVPIGRLEEIEAATGISRTLLRPDVFRETAQEGV